VSANEYSCAHHVTWSPNKLWRSTSIFILHGVLTKEKLFLKEQIENLVGYSLCHSVKIICLTFITFDILENES
jgi:hypothetical protein